MNLPVEFLDLDDVVELAVALLGDPPPIRDLGLLGSAVARPQTMLFGQDAYPDIWSKAAALLQSIVNNHALIDGNKRLGWLATAVFLEINGIEISRADNDAVYDLVLDIAAGNPQIEQIASGLILGPPDPELMAEAAAAFDHVERANRSRARTRSA